jgi:hypothetical protein
VTDDAWPACANVLTVAITIYQFLNKTNTPMLVTIHRSYSFQLLLAFDDGVLLLNVLNIRLVWLKFEGGVKTITEIYYILLKLVK